MITVKFFASLREDIGCASLNVPAQTLAQLRSTLSEQLGEGAQQALWADGVRMAVNQQFLESDWRTASLAIEGNTEIAFLPPVTGG